jgi:hypothetical protein
LLLTGSSHQNRGQGEIKMSMIRSRGVAARLAGWALLALLTACGGGGSGSGGGTPVSNDLGAHVSTTSLQVQRDLQDRSLPSETFVVSLLIDRPPAGSYYYRETHSAKAINFVGIAPRSGDAGIDFQIQFLQPAVLGMGAYNDTLTIEACIDAGCQQQALGSPFTVHVNLLIGYLAPSESGVPPLAVASSVALPHDLVDAVYSAALDAVVSVSSLPGPALNVYDLATGQTRSIALATAPTAVSLAPDGLRAAVGHDAAVSVVTLAPPGGTMSVVRYPVTQPVGEVLFDGHGRVFSFGNQHFNWNAMHTLDLATGVDNPGTGFDVNGVPHAVLHPSGNRFYFANENVSPDDIFSVGSLDQVPGSIVDSPYHGQYAMCGQVWAAPDGLRLYTACGNVFSSSPIVDQDMLYAGAMALTPPSGSDFQGYEAVALSVDPSSSEVVLLEQSRFYCDPRQDQMINCFTHLNTYSASTLALESRYSLPPVTVGGNRFAQDGRFVFHRANGRVVVLGQLRSTPDPAAGIRLSQLP